MTRPARALVNLRALQANFQVARSAAPVSKIMAVVKADGYGHGAARVARALDAADAFGVASLDEAIELRDAGIRHPIVLLEGFFDVSELDLIVHHGLDVVVHHVRQLEILEKTRITPLIPVWIKIDTGMHRLGFPPGDVARVVQRLLACPSVRRPLRFISHLGCADDRDSEVTAEQQACFVQTLNGISGERSLANSAGILAWPTTHMDWVRPGIMLYGVPPFIQSHDDHSTLQPVMTLTTELIAVNNFSAGDRVGYGGDWECPEDMRIGVAAIGYGDGYPRNAPQGTTILVNDKPAKLIGRVSMDMICLDLREVPEAKVGDRVELWGPHLPVDELARQCGTIAYELLTRVSSRVNVSTQAL